MRSGKLFMELIYRGYPLALQQAARSAGTVMVQSTEMQPYMLYKREEQTREENGRRRIRAEHDYFKGLYPMTVRRWQVMVDEMCDRYDYPGSPIYDEYPDRESLFRMRDRIIRSAGVSGLEEDRNLAYVLLLAELCRRRAIRKCE